MFVDGVGVLRPNVQIEGLRALALSRSIARLGPPRNLGGESLPLALSAIALSFIDLKIFQGPRSVSILGNFAHPRSTQHGSESVLSINEPTHSINPITEVY